MKPQKAGEDEMSNETIIAEFKEKERVSGWRFQSEANALNIALNKARKAGEQSALAKFRKQVGELKKIYRNPFVHKDIDKCFPDCAEPVSSDRKGDKKD